MARLGVIGSSSSPVKTSGGRIGALAVAPKPTQVAPAIPKIQLSQGSGANKSAGGGGGRGANNETTAPTKTDRSLGGFLKSIPSTAVKFAQGVGGILNPVQDAKTIVDQTKISVKSGGAIDKASPDLLKVRDKSIDDALSKKQISKQRADQEKAQAQSDYGTAQAKVKGVEKQVGATYDPSAGAEAAIGTVAGLMGLGDIPRVVFKAAAEQAAKKAGRDLTEDELTTLAQKTKATVPDRTGSTPLIKKETPAPSEITPLRENNPLPTAPKINAKISDDLKTVPHLDSKIKTVKAGDLKLGSDTFGSEVDPKVVDKYKADIKAGKPIDPIVVSKKDGQLFVQDGQHRLEAAKQLGITDIPTVEQLPKNAPIKESLSERYKPEPIEPAPKPEGDKTSGNSLRIQQKAVEEKLNQNMGNLPQYKSINMKDQAERATDLVTNDRQKAIDIIDGKANPPDGLHPQSVHQALEVAAIKEKDGALLTKLANSHINTELSEGAQKLRIAAERDPLSATEQIRQIQEARAKRLGNSVRTDTKKELQKAIKVVKAKTRINSKADLAGFIKELEC